MTSITQLLWVFYYAVFTLTLRTLNYDVIMTSLWRHYDDDVTSVSVLFLLLPLEGSVMTGSVSYIRYDIRGYELISGVVN